MAIVVVFRACARGLGETTAEQEAGKGLQQMHAVTMLGVLNHTHGSDYIVEEEGSVNAVPTSTE